MLAALVNGASAEQLPLTDRALHYGDGLFETIAVHHGQPVQWSRHLQRLLHGCERLQLPAPDTQQLFAEVQHVASNHERVVVKIIYSRGSGGRGYRPPEAAQPSRIVIAYAWPAYPVDWAEQGVRLHLCQTACASSPALAGLKHLNKLEHVLARAEWDAADIAEGVMCDGNGYVIEGTMSNLLWFKQGRLHTPDLTHSGVAGTTRARILELAAAQGITCEQGRYTLQDLLAADALMVCNAVIGLWPVRQCGEQQYAVSENTRRLQRLLAEQTQQEIAL